MSSKGGRVSWNRGKKLKEMMMVARPCRHCGQTMSIELLAERERIRKERHAETRAASKACDEFLKLKVGR